MTRNPYFRSHYPKQDMEISKGYSDMGKAMVKFLRNKVIVYTSTIVLVGFIMPYTIYFVLIPFLLNIP